MTHCFSFRIKTSLLKKCYQSEKHLKMYVEYLHAIECILKSESSDVMSYINCANRLCEH